MYRERTSRSTMRVRSDAKSIAWPINPSRRAQPIKYRSRGDQEGDEDRGEDQRCRGDRKSRLHEVFHRDGDPVPGRGQDRKSTRLNSSHLVISYAVFCLKKKKKKKQKTIEASVQKHT